jgi:archaellum component FlaC
MEELNEKLDKIIHKLERIENRLNIVEESCNGMDNHINFVNNVYSTIRTPLDFMVNQVGRLQGMHQTLALPENYTE